MKKQRQKVWIGLSGGLDSSVAARLLKQAGYALEGVHLRLWEAPGQLEALQAVQALADFLSIPLRVLDWRASFKQEVIEHYLAALAQNLTPNPCVRCNQAIKWGRLLEFALDEGADFLASGHYARLETGSDGQALLYKAMDSRKDQSYFLAGLPRQSLSRILLPLADQSKRELRAMAAQAGLPTWQAPESEDLCFLAGGDQAAFLQEHAPHLLQPGPIQDTQGKVLGEHKGLALYTIGQRKGIGIAAAQPYYVLAKEPLSNTLRVGWAETLSNNAILTGAVNWLVPQPPGVQESVQVKIRSGARPVAARCQILKTGDMIARLEKPLRDITAGQLLVLYQDELCLGSAEIKAGLNQGNA